MNKFHNIIYNNKNFFLIKKIKKPKYINNRIEKIIPNNESIIKRYKEL